LLGFNVCVVFQTLLRWDAGNKSTGKVKGQQQLHVGSFKMEIPCMNTIAWYQMINVNASTCTSS